MNIKLIISLALLGLTVLFTLQNTAVVDLRFFFWSLSMSRALMVYCVLAVGLVAGWMLASWSYHQKSRAREKSETSETKAEEEKGL